MLHENVKFYFKVIYRIETHYNTRQIFCFCGITYMNFWELMITYPKVVTGPPSAKFAPLVHTSSYATAFQ